ncbi:MAG: BlaI/MecI/CopY family transcriptional regulator [Thainema sp.]
MPPLPDYTPKHLSLGSLEAEILSILWQRQTATVKDIHDQILADPDRELAYASVTTVLNRLAKKGWVRRQKQGKAFCWQPRISQVEAKVLHSHDQLQKFLAVSNPDIVAAFADSLDAASLEQLDAIAQQIQAARQRREAQS